MKYQITLILLIAGTALANSNLNGQQMPISLFQRIQPGWFNPGHSPEKDLTEVFLSQQQRNISFADFRSGTSLLHLQSGLKGKSKGFSIGLQMSHDREHTEQRLSLSPSISARVIQKSNSWLSLGISAGILNWNSNYVDRRVGDDRDPILQGRSNFLELDAGVGAQFHLENKFLDINAEVSATQLTGNLITDQLPGLEIIPHFQGRCRILFKPVYNLKVGPFGWYGNTFNNSEISYQTGLTEMGITTHFIRQGFWIASSYRLDFSAINMAFGLRSFRNDTINRPEKAPFQMDMQMAFSYPVQQSGIFGPSVELGLVFHLGKRILSTVDTFHNAHMFWDGEASNTQHKVNYLDPNGPPGLTAQTEVSDKQVYLTYSFPDNSLRYAGETPTLRDTVLEDIGYEWIGVNGLLENLISEVIQEALHPDSNHVRDPENLEPLKSISSIEISSSLRESGFGIHMSSGMLYSGDIGFNNPGGDTLFIEVIFDERDTLLALTTKQYLSNLELSALKLHGMRKKLDYELRKSFEDNFDVIWEGQSIDLENFQTPILIKKLRILSDNPNQQAFQVNQIEMKLARHKQYWAEEEDDGWMPVEEWKEQRNQQKKRKRRTRK